MAESTVIRMADGSTYNLFGQDFRTVERLMRESRRTGDHFVIDGETQPGKIKTALNPYAVISITQRGD